MANGIVKGLRIARAVVEILVVESLIFGLAVLPAVGFWQWVSDKDLGTPFVNALLTAVSVAPAYLIFSIGLMGFTVLFAGLLRWRTPEGEHALADMPPEIFRWAKYNVASHVVRVICGEFFRATPIWIWYLRGMGARVGRGVHINTAALYDINLFTLEDHVVIGGRAQISAHLVEGGLVKAYPVIFRRGSTVGTCSIVSPGVEVGEGGRIGALSFVTKKTRVPPHTAYGGVPARFLKEYEAKPVSDEDLLYREPGAEEA